MPDREERICEAFDDVPRIENPKPINRWAASQQFPAVVVPADGPIPDPHHDYRASMTVEVPDWIVYSVETMLEGYDDLNEGDVEDMLLDFVQLHPDYVTSDGRSVFDVVLDRDGDDLNRGEPADD